ncbi:retrovirus-related pol polyprotein from transposon TNT 1-94, partial [Tanacetum coccineum]
MNRQTSSIPQIAYQLPQVTIQLMTESPFVDLSFAIPVFSLGDDPIACLNKAMAFLMTVASSRFPSTNNQLRTSMNLRNQATIQDGKSNATSSRGNNASGQARVVKCYNCQGEGHMARKCTQPKRPRNATWYKDKAMLVEAQEAGQILDEEQLTFLTDPETENLDTYDSNCDNISNAKAILTANISNYGFDVISEVPHSETYLNDMENQGVHAMQDFEKILVVDFTDNEIHSDSNIIPYSQYFQETQQENIQDTNLQTQQDLMILSVIKQMLRMCNPTSKTFDASPVKIEAPKELPKVSLVNESLKKLKFHLVQFDNVVKIRTTPDARTEDLLNEIMEVQIVFDQIDAAVQQSSVDKQCLEISKKELLLENDRLLQQIMSQDVLLTVMNSMSLFGESVNMVFKEQFDSIKKTCVRTKEHSGSLIDKLNLKSAENEDLKAQLQDKVESSLTLDSNTPMLSPTGLKCSTSNCGLKPSSNKRNARISTSANVLPPKKTTSHSVETQKLELKVYSRKPKNVKNVGSSKKAKIVESKNANHSEPNSTWGSNATDIPSSSSLVMTVRFGNDHIARIMGYGDYQLENVTISRVYCVEGLGHNLFFVGQFCDADLEVAFRKNTCFICNLEDVDLLSGSQGTNLYTVSLDDMLKTSLICLLSKASKTKSWLWHRRLSHLNFGTLNKLAKDGLAQGIPMLKFQKDHLCSACALGKSKKSSHQPKAEDTNQEKLYLLHMDLCGPMRVAS